MRSSKRNKSIYFEKKGISFGKEYHSRQLGEFQIHPPNQNHPHSWSVIQSKSLYSSPSDFSNFKSKKAALEFIKARENLKNYVRLK